MANLNLVSYAFKGAGEVRTQNPVERSPVSSFYKSYADGALILFTVFLGPSTHSPNKICQAKVNETC